MYTPGRYLELAFKQLGVPIQVFTHSVDFSKVNLSDSTAVLFIESPSRPSIKVKNIEQVTIPKFFWIHHGENRLKNNLQLCKRYKPDVILMAHSLHLSSHFSQEVRFFPFAISSIFIKDRPFTNRKYGMAFAGEYRSPIYAKRTANLRRLSDHLSKKAIPSSLYSKKYVNELADLYSNAKIVFNQTANRYPSFNMRIFEGLGCGALVLTDRVEEQDKVFTEDVHYVVFKDSKDLLHKVDYYLDHEEEAEKIAVQGQQYAIKHHTYEKRVEELLLWIESL
ncbi:hypothetical protein BTR23_13735 [Alkalihalophilus pseudofirmus]|nr:hypothetical protein BTR23_13735 [Alkalihalophilus pseudofirmus]